MSKNEFICDCTSVHEDAVADVKAAMRPIETLRRTADFFKLLGDETRIRIVSALDKREMCVCDIAVLLSMTKSAVSHQLAVLRGASAVKCRREGKIVYYSLSDAHIKSILEAGIEHVEEEK